MGVEDLTFEVQIGVEDLTFEVQIGVDTGLNPSTLKMQSDLNRTQPTSGAAVPAHPGRTS